MSGQQPFSNLTANFSRSRKAKIAAQTEKLKAEYNDVLNRERIISLCPLTDDEKMKLLKAFMSVCSWVRIYYLWRPNLLDEGDNHLIELAVAGNAQAIVTNNIKDFKQSQLRFRGLQILTPKQVLDLDLS